MVELMVAHYPLPTLAKEFAWLKEAANSDVA